MVFKMVEIFFHRPSVLDTGTLGSGTALLLDQLTSNSTRNFMTKNIVSLVQATYPDAGDSIVLVLGNSDSSVVEIAEALENTTQDLETNPEYRDDQVKLRRVWDIQPLMFGNVDAGQGVQQKIQWKLPPKGIPTLKGQGLSIYAYNPQSGVALSNGPTIKSCFTKRMGGWF